MKKTRVDVAIECAIDHGLERLKECNHETLQLTDRERNLIYSQLGSIVRCLKAYRRGAWDRDNPRIEAMINLPVIDKFSIFNPLPSCVFRSVASNRFLVGSAVLTDLRKLARFVDHLVDYLVEQNMIKVRRVR